MDRAKAMLLVRSALASSQVITEYLRDKGYNDEKIGECLNYLYFQGPMLMQGIAEAIVEYLRREHNICKLVRFNPLGRREELLMVF